MKQIYIVLCLSLLSGVAHADKWLCGTSSWWPAGPGWICGTDRAENPERRYRQYFFILDETRKDEDGLSRITFREVDGKVAFNGDVCSDTTEAELGCYNDSHYFSFFRKTHIFHYWRYPHTKDSFRVSGRCALFEDYVANSYFDHKKALIIGMTPKVSQALKDTIVSWYDLHLASKRKAL